jgi:predicted nucleotidyltransferase
MIFVARGGASADPSGLGPGRTGGAEASVLTARVSPRVAGECKGCAPLALSAGDAHLTDMSVDLAPVVTLLRREIPGLAAVYLFGSCASRDARPESDVDLAVFAGRPLPRPAVVDLQLRIANMLNRDVDLVDLAAADTILQVQVIGEGKLIDAADADAAAFFEVRVFRDYQDLKQRRLATEADIVARGRVHA